MSRRRRRHPGGHALTLGGLVGRLGPLEAVDLGIKEAGPLNVGIELHDAYAAITAFGLVDPARDLASRLGVIAGDHPVDLAREAILAGFPVYLGYGRDEPVEVLYLQNRWGQDWGEHVAPLLDIDPERLYREARAQEMPMNTVAAQNPASFDFQSHLVAPYRELRERPRDGMKAGEAGALTDPAPPWASDLAAAIVRIAPTGHFTSPATVDQPSPMHVGEMALRWCSFGEPVSRASRLLALLELWPGSPVDRIVALARYLKIVHQTGAGRAKETDDGRPCQPRPFDAPITHATWDQLERARPERNQSAFQVAKPLAAELGITEADKIGKLAHALAGFANAKKHK